ncbi:MAG: PilZ domain-containing protein, partial [Myxococcota bacterium]
MVAHALDGQRRRHPRHELCLVVAVAGGEQQLGGWTENVTHDGLFVQTDMPLCVGDEVTLRLSFPALLRPVELTARVAWQRRSTLAAAAGVGLQVLDETGRRVLCAILDTFAEPAVRTDGAPFRILMVEDNLVPLHSDCEWFRRLLSPL